MNFKTSYILAFILLLSGLIGCFPFNTSIDENNSKRKIILSGNATVTGYVFDNIQKPIVGTSIFLMENHFIGALSDLDGYFRIDKVPLGQHKIRFAALVHTSADRNIYISADSTYLMDTIFLKIDSNKVRSIGTTIE